LFNIKKLKSFKAKLLYIFDRNYFSKESGSLNFLKMQAKLKESGTGNNKRIALLTA
jgi:hypothetical protein